MFKLYVTPSVGQGPKTISTFMTSRLALPSFVELKEVITYRLNSRASYIWNHRIMLIALPVLVGR